jgi:uncharacterized membrane protein YfcA
MRELKRILAVFLLGLAFLFLWRIPTNLRSAEPKAHGRAGADIFLALVLGGSAFALGLGGKKADQ